MEQVDVLYPTTKNNYTRTLLNHISQRNNNLEKQKNINIKIQLKMETIQLTKSEFIKKITDFEKNPTTWKYLGDKPAIIDFYATWCGPCKAVSPIMEELAEEYKDSIYVYKVDTDKEQELSALFGIRSIPSVLFIPMEGAPQMSVGAIPKSGFEKAVHDILLTK